MQKTEWDIAVGSHVQMRMIRWTRNAGCSSPRSQPDFCSMKVRMNQNGDQKQFLLAKCPAESVWNGANEVARNGSSERRILQKQTSLCASLLYGPSQVYARTEEAANKRVWFWNFRLGNDFLSARVPVYPVVVWAGPDWAFPWCSFKLTLWVPGEPVVGVTDCWVWRIGNVCSVQMASAMRESSSLKISQMVGKNKFLLTG